MADVRGPGYGRGLLSPNISLMEGRDWRGLFFSSSARRGSGSETYSGPTFVAVGWLEHIALGL
jgi:hypothetical protein